MSYREASVSAVVIAVLSMLFAFLLPAGAHTLVDLVAAGWEFGGLR